MAQTTCTFRVLSGLMCLLVAFASGCSGSRPKTNAPTRPANDPLLGGPVIPSEGGLFNRTDDAIVKGPTTPLPLPEAPPPSGGPASLVGGQPRPLGDTASLAPPPDWRTGENPSRPTNVVPVGATSQSGDYDRLMGQLDALGVTWRELKSWGDGEWHFSCAIPHPQNPSIQHKYEATAKDRSGLAAIRAVLEKIRAEG